MRRDHPDVRAGLDRKAAALILRDRAMEVSGVQSAKVRVRRSKAAVRAVSHFRDLDEVRTDLERAIATGVDELGSPAHPRRRYGWPGRPGRDERADDAPREDPGAREGPAPHEKNPPRAKAPAPREGTSRAKTPAPPEGARR